MRQRTTSNTRQSSSSIAGRAERDFISAKFARGAGHEEIRDELVLLGWHRVSAERLLDAYAKSNEPQNTTAPPQPDLAGLPTEIDAEGQPVRVLLRMRLPDLYLLGDVVTPQECSDLIALAAPTLARSRVFATDVHAEDDAGELSYSRTSRQTSFRRGSVALVDLIQRRVAKIVRWPVDQMEDLQVVHYGVGAEFTPHYDFFSEEMQADLIARCGHRVGTALFYLNTPPQGGMTVFSDVELEIFPQRGNMVVFTYPEIHADSLTLHAGAPLGSGEKWIGTFFLHDRPIKRKRLAMSAADGAV